MLAYTPLLTPITTCLPATLVCQLFAPADAPTSMLFLCFWAVPPLLVFSYRRLADYLIAAKDPKAPSPASVNSASYFLFLVAYLGFMLALVLRVVAVNGWQKYLNNAVADPVLWLTLVSSILLTNVALSDLLAALSASREVRWHTEGGRGEAAGGGQVTAQQDDDDDAEAPELAEEADDIVGDEVLPRSPVPPTLLIAQVERRRERKRHGWLWNLFHS